MNYLLLISGLSLLINIPLGDAQCGAKFSINAKRHKAQNIWRYPGVVPGNTAFQIIPAQVDDFETVKPFIVNTICCLVLSEVTVSLYNVSYGSEFGAITVGICSKLLYSQLFELDQSTDSFRQQMLTIYRETTNIIFEGNQNALNVLAAFFQTVTGPELVGPFNGIFLPSLWRKGREASTAVLSHVPIIRDRFINAFRLLEEASISAQEKIQKFLSLLALIPRSDVPVAIP